MFKTNLLFAIALFVQAGCNNKTDSTAKNVELESSTLTAVAAKDLQFCGFEEKIPVATGEVSLFDVVSHGTKYEAVHQDDKRFAQMAGTELTEEEFQGSILSKYKFVEIYQKGAPDGNYGYYLVPEGPCSSKMATMKVCGKVFSGTYLQSITFPESLNVVISSGLIGQNDITIPVLSSIEVSGSAIDCKAHTKKGKLATSFEKGDAQVLSYDNKSKRGIPEDVELSLQ